MHPHRPHERTIGVTVLHPKPLAEDQPLLVSVEFEVYGETQGSFRPLLCRN